MVDIPVRLKPDTREAEEAFSSFGSKLTASLAGAVAGLGILKAAWSGVVDFVKQGIELAGKQREAEDLLSAAMKRRGDVTGEGYAKLKQFNEELARKYALDVTEVASLERQLALHGVTNQALAGAAQATIGLAAVTGGDLSSAGNQVAKILEGNVGFLKKLGIEAKSSEEAIEKLSSIAATDAVDKLGTYSGQVQRLEADWRRFQEALFQKTGDEKQTLAYRAVEALDSIVQRATNDAHDLKGALRDALAGLAGGTLAAASTLIPGLGLLAPDIASGTFDALKAPAPRAPIRTSADEFVGPVVSDAQRGIRAAAISADGERNRKAKEEADKKLLEQMKKDDRAREEQEKVWVERQKARLAAEEKLNEERLKTQEEFAKKSAALAQSQADFRAQLEDSRFAASIATLSTQEQTRLQMIRSGVNMQIIEEQRRNQTVRDLQDQAAQIASTGMANTIAGMAKAIGEGQGNLAKLMASLVGGVIVQMGTLLIQLGTAGVLAGTLGSIIPAFLGITGGPLGVTAGLAAIAGGAAMVALGSAMGAVGASPSGTTAPNAGGAPSGSIAQQQNRSYSGPGTYSNQPPDQQPARPIYVYFDKGVIAAEPRPFARQLTDYLQKGNLSLSWGG